MATPFFGKREDPAPARAATNSYANPLTAASPPAPLKPLNDMTSLTANGGSKLTVGPNIKLKGVEITDCDTLIVDGLVEAAMNARVMLISEQGAFKGKAELDLAEIRGEFDGHLTVRQKLVIYATGKVTGTVRYGKLVVEDGAQLSGDVVFGTQGHDNSLSKPAPVVKTGLQAAA